MSHSNHQDLEGNNLPSVSQIPSIFAKDMDGFEDWICRGLHTKEEKCCTKAKRDYYKETANLGNDIHELREAFLRGEPFVDGVPEYQARVFDPVAKFYKESGYKPLGMPYIENTPNYAIELKMTGKEFGGTLDGAGTFSFPFWKERAKTFYDRHSLNYIAETEEFPDLILPTVKTIWVDDLKIKSKLDKLHPLQLYGYSLLLKEVYGITTDWGLIIRREKKLDKRPKIQLKGYYLPAYKEQWDAAMTCWRFING